MPDSQANNPLHGVTLEMILTELVKQLGWRDMARVIEIRCFMFNPTIKSSLQFLRRTPWARKKVEELYLRACKFPTLTQVVKSVAPAGAAVKQNSHS
jgi:uncharacterized protein (DUF2132 family)